MIIKEVQYRHTGTTDSKLLTNAKIKVIFELQLIQASEIVKGKEIKIDGLYGGTINYDVIPTGRYSFRYLNPNIFSSIYDRDHKNIQIRLYDMELNGQGFHPNALVIANYVASQLLEQKTIQGLLNELINSKLELIDKDWEEHQKTIEKLIEYREELIKIKG